MAPDPSSPRNRLIPRLAAFGIFLLSAGVLVYVHRTDIFPTAPATNPTEAAFTRCVKGSIAKLDKMRSEGLIREAQWRLFRDRAEARCRARSGGVGNPPPPPALR